MGDIQDIKVVREVPGQKEKDQKFVQELSRAISGMITPIIEMQQRFLIGELNALVGKTVSIVLAKMKEGEKNVKT